MHEIHESDTVLLGGGKSAWHNLGIVRPEGHVITIDEAHQTVAPWEPKLVPVYLKAEDTTFDGSPIFTPIPDKVATVRPDNGEVLGILSDEYGLFPNKDGFALAEAIVNDPNVEVETAGTLRGGKLVWVLLKLNRELDVNGDKLDPYLLVRWSHDGSTAVSVDVTCVRVVCKNTWNAAESRATRSWRARHTGSIVERAHEARGALRLADTYLDDFEAEVKALQETLVTNARFEEIVRDEFPIDSDLGNRARLGRERKREAIQSLWNNDPRVGPFQGTGWGAVQAFSTWEEHERTVVGDRNERRALRSIQGSALCERVRDKVLVT
jgi:phage/plasmid-like protein (TIGR03299 family)